MTILAFGDIANVSQRRRGPTCIYRGRLRSGLDNRQRSRSGRIRSSRAKDAELPIQDSLDG